MKTELKELLDNIVDIVVLFLIVAFFGLFMLVVKLEAKLRHLWSKYGLK